MKKSRFSEEQIVGMLKEVEAGGYRLQTLEQEPEQLQGGLALGPQLQKGLRPLGLRKKKSRRAGKRG